MLDGIRNTGFILLYIQFFPFRNFSFEFLFNGVVFIQYWIKMIHPLQMRIGEQLIDVWYNQIRQETFGMATSDLGVAIFLSGTASA